jgi:transaldolase
MNQANPLLKLKSLGQSIWIDLISRAMLDKGELARLIKEDGVTGVTSNPTIFEKAIDQSADYDASIEALAREGKSSEAIFWTLAVEDIQRAADLLRPIYDQTGGRDGFASIEVSPNLARDAELTSAEAARLWDAVGRPNVFVKVPATREGLEAISRLTAEGINVNVTLLFGLSRYYEVCKAYIDGLEALAAREHSMEQVASVASFFLSRIDTLIDPMLDEFAKAGGKQGELARGLRGKAAIASARVAYQVFKETFGSQHFKWLAGQGARPQRLLWASTSAKDPAFSAVKYIDPIIAAGTVNTMPLETIEAYRQQGQPLVRIEEELSESYWVLERLGDLGIELDVITQRLENEGIARFSRDYDRLIEAIERKRQAALGGKPMREAA